MLRSIERRSDERVVPYRMTGNKGAGRLSDEHLLLLVLFKLAHPESLLGQCVVFIAMHSEDAVVFQEGDIARALKMLGYTRKVGSTVAKQAFTQVNLEKFHMFWNYPYPAGVVGIQRRFLIDVDECCFVLEGSNQHYEHAVKGLRVQKPGNYGQGLIQITIILAIEPGDPNLLDHVEGSVARPR